MRETYCGKDSDDAYGLVPDKACGKSEERPEVKRLAAERVD